jgi:RND family efflux transporter MFP subunit
MKRLIVLAISAALCTAFVSFKASSSSSIDAKGTLQPSLRIDVRPQTSGILSEVYIEEGQWVEPGTPLMKVDPTNYLLKVQESEAQLAMDLAGLKAAEKKWGRFKDLAEKNLVSQMEWDEVEAQVSRAKAVVSLDQARLSLAKLEVERCVLKSPIAGRVGKLDAVPGLLVSNGQSTPLATIANMSTLIVEFHIPEGDAARLPDNLDNVNISIGCTSGLCSIGKVTFVDHQFDAKTGLLLLRGRVTNSSGQLRPGQTVHVSLPTTTKG